MPDIKSNIGSFVYRPIDVRSSQEIFSTIPSRFEISVKVTIFSRLSGFNKFIEPFDIVFCAS